MAEPRGGVAGYDVFVGESPGAESTIPVNGAALVTGKSLDVTGLTDGVTYYFVVRAVGIWWACRPLPTRSRPRPETATEG